LTTFSETNWSLCTDFAGQNLAHWTELQVGRRLHRAKRSRARRSAKGGWNGVGSIGKRCTFRCRLSAPLPWGRSRRRLPPLA